MINVLGIGAKWFSVILLIVVGVFQFTKAK